MPDLLWLTLHDLAIVVAALMGYEALRRWQSRWRWPKRRRWPKEGMRR